MDIQRITDALRERFQQDGHRLVFWHDPERAFEESLPELTQALAQALDGVSLLRLDESPTLAIKVRLELDNPAGRYLLYAPFEPPAPDEDWLLDIRLYSGSFSADRASMLLSDLGLTTQSLRSHLAERARFFASRERLERLKRLIAPDDSAIDLDRKLIAVLIKADHPEFFTLLITLLDGIPDGQLDEPPPLWSDLDKFGVEAAFWQLVEAHFGWQDEAPTLKGLLIRLMVSDLANALGSAVPAGLAHLVLPKRGVANAVVCLAQWRDSSARSPSYERLSAAVAEAIKLDQQISGLELQTLQEAKTFLRIEQAIAGRLRDRVLETAERIDAEAVRTIASQRQDGYWASTQRADTETAPRQALHAVYQALETAADLFALHNAEQLIPEPADAQALFSAYTKRLYRFDQHYRHFCECADAAEARGWDILKALRERVEQTYGNGFLAELALRWNRHLAQGLLAHWRLPDLANQQQFFAREVAPILAKGQDRGVFVIISDAFRYEAAQELTARLNGRYRFEAKL
ncbi:MAG: BREX-1 system phosphatase PglZ type A, partial [Chromatiaceae bacterium]|nr:BREX-1 system phosphatase PglZ type A [Chromatiaceae bacterium]